MAVIRRPRDGALLVSEHADQARAPFQRPLGGHVEFGERSEDAVHRELLEEIGQSLRDVRLLGVLENIFDWEGSRAHEIVFVFSASLQDDTAYEIAEQRILDHADDDKTRVVWRGPGTASPPLYPDGVAGLITPEPPADSTALPPPSRARKEPPMVAPAPMTIGRETT
jgi:ADP-ribose pyrophosphatase YjhB (NUDIX family)